MQDVSCTCSEQLECALTAARAHALRGVIDGAHARCLQIERQKCRKVRELCTKANTKRASAALTSTATAATAIVATAAAAAAAVSTTQVLQTSTVSFAAAPALSHWCYS
eukprot:10079-Heterococcus_DN1.PRE.5